MTNLLSQSPQRNSDIVPFKANIESDIETALNLVQAGLLESAQILCRLLLSLLHDNNEREKRLRKEVLLTYACALSESGETHRSKAIYENAFHASEKHIGSKLAAPARTHREIFASSCEQIGDIDTAIETLEDKHSDQRSTRTLGLLVRLYRQTDGFPRAMSKVVKLCKALLRTEPFAVELHVLLLQLDEFDPKLLPERESLAAGWLRDFMHIQCEMSVNNFGYAIQAFEGMQDKLGLEKNIDILSCIANGYMSTGDDTQGLEVFRKIHFLDPLVIRDMDKFALLLKKGKYLHELRNLVASLIDFAPAAPETLTSIAHAYLAGAFTYGREANRPADVENQPMEREDGNLKLAVARAWDLTAQARCPFSDEAGLHADMLDQALHSYPKHTEALRLRAELFMQNEDASRACEIYEQILLGNDGDLNANEGKIYALMELDRDAAAWAHAEYMTKMFPDNARVLALYAALRSKKRDDDANEDRAQEDFEKAMKCDKRCVQAVLGLSAIKGRDSHDDEIKFLKDYIMETSAPPAVYHRLADLQQDKGEPYEAEKNLRTALRAKGCNLREVDVKVEKWRKEHYPDSGDDASDGFGDPDIEGENV